MKKEKIGRRNGAKKNMCKQRQKEQKKKSTFFILVSTSMRIMLRYRNIWNVAGYFPVTFIFPCTSPFTSIFIHNYIIVNGQLFSLFHFISSLLKHFIIPRISVFKKEQNLSSIIFEISLHKNLKKISEI